ncbi:MAG: class I SAM-dependent methyltransferase [Candidatus Omnitrophota bacterium]
MNFLEKLYIWFRNFILGNKKKVTPSSGYFPSRVRQAALTICEDKRGFLLEIGCGEGLFLTALGPKIFHSQLIGIDYDNMVLKELAKDIKNRNPENIKIIRSEAKITPFRDNYFDIVICINMLYNLSSEKEMVDIIKEMVRLCNQKGSIIFDVRNKCNPLLYFGYKWVKYYNPSCPWPLKTYRLKEIDEILKKLSLRVARKIPIGFPLKWLAPVVLFEVVKE